jgi:hypothetical protein
MDTHFKLLCAWEELDHLNIEIHCIATHLWDEDHYLRTCKEAAHHTDPALAHQIFIHCMLRGRFKILQAQLFLAKVWTPAMVQACFLQQVNLHLLSYYVCVA